MHDPAVLELSSGSVKRLPADGAGVFSLIMSSVVSQLGGSDKFPLYSLSAFMQTVSPFYAVRRKFLPSVSVYVSSFEMSFYYIFIAKPLATYPALAFLKLPIQKLFGNAAILHSEDMPGPAQLN